MEEKLIEAVRIRTVLYDTSHEDYLKTKLKAENWEDVAKETSIRNGTEAKAMWEKLRHSLRDALRRQQKFIKSGAAAESIKRWKFQQQMGFLLPYMANKAREGNLNEDTDCESQTQNVDIDDEKNNEKEKIQKEISVQLEAEPQTPPTSTKKMKKETIAGLLKRSIEQHEERKKLRTEERKNTSGQINTPSDPLYHFFMSMYQTTKNMPQSSQFAVRNDIFRVVTNKEATLMNIPSRSPQAYPDHPASSDARR